MLNFEFVYRGRGNMDMRLRRVFEERGEQCSNGDTAEEMAKRDGSRDIEPQERVSPFSV